MQLLLFSCAIIVQYWMIHGSPYNYITTSVMFIHPNVLFLLLVLYKLRQWNLMMGLTFLMNLIQSSSSYKKTFSRKSIRWSNLSSCFWKHLIHKMFITSFMLDPHFRFLWVVENYVGFGETIRLAFEYDAKIVIPFLMTWFDWFNPISQACATTIDASNS
jgi:hypothetical protein